AKRGQHGCKHNREHIRQAHETPLCNKMSRSVCAWNPAAGKLGAGLMRHVGTASPVAFRSGSQSRFRRRCLGGDAGLAISELLLAHESIESFLDELEGSNAGELTRQRDRSTREFQEGLTVSWNQVKHNNSL